MEKVKRLDYVDVCKWLGISLVMARYCCRAQFLI